MKRRKLEKSFDCVGFKRKVQAEIYEEIKGLSPDEASLTETARRSC